MRSAQALVIVAAVSATVGCRNRDEARRAAERATAEAEEIAERASETTLTGATIEIDALRSEQDAYRKKLVEALDALDRDPKSHGRRAVARRETLKRHLDAVDRSTREDWAALKAKIDRDLDRGGR